MRSARLQGHRVLSREWEGEAEVGRVLPHVPSGDAEAACHPLTSSSLVPSCPQTVMLGLDHLTAVLPWPGSAMQSLTKPDASHLP